MVLLAPDQSAADCHPLLPHLLPRGQVQQPLQCRQQDLLQLRDWADVQHQLRHRAHHWGLLLQGPR